MIEAKYVGGLAGVVVLLPSGRRLTAWRDEPVELLPSEVEALASNPEWDVSLPEDEPDVPALESASQEDDES